jgi:hypothetical protein
MTEQPGRELIDTLVDGLTHKDVLLVLDNVEHVYPAAWVAERLLAAASRLRILATSRAPLRLYGEQEQQVPPLELPDLGQPHELEAVSRNEAIALFTDRARAASPAFVLTDQNARIVADVCARLDGVPLAIELAASRTKALTPQGILSRLATGPDVLIATARNLPPRQRTVRATIDWRCALLTDPQRFHNARGSVGRGAAWSLAEMPFRALERRQANRTRPRSRMAITRGSSVSPTLDHRHMAAVEVGALTCMSNSQASSRATGGQAATPRPTAVGSAAATLAARLAPIPASRDPQASAPAGNPILRRTSIDIDRWVIDSIAAHVVP